MFVFLRDAPPRAASAPRPCGTRQPDATPMPAGSGGSIRSRAPRPAPRIASAIDLYMYHRAAPMRGLREHPRRAPAPRNPYTSHCTRHAHLETKKKKIFIHFSMNNNICICILFSMKNCAQNLCAFYFSCADLFFRAMKALKIQGFSRVVSAHEMLIFCTYAYTYSKITIGSGYCSRFLNFN